MFRLPFLLFTLLILTACSPHPTAGGWIAIIDDAAFERLEIRYNGRADLYTLKGDSSAAWRCFWAAKDETTAQMKCVEASNADNEQIYWFRADKASKEGSLTFGEQLLGRYSWQPPTDPPEEE